MEPVTAQRITVGLLPLVAEQLGALHDRTGMTKADIINRSVTLYDFIDGRLAAGDDLLIRSAATGEIERIKLI